MSIGQNLAQIIKQKNVSIAELQKKTGISRSSINNILLETSQNPGTNTLQTIAKALNITIEEILNNNQNLYQALNKEDFEIFLRICSSTIELIDNKNSKVSFSQFMQILREVYQYSLRQSPPNIDKNFIDWIIDKTTI